MDHSSRGDYQADEKPNNNAPKQWYKRLSKSLTLTISIVIGVLLIGGASYALFLNGAAGPSASNQSGSINLDSGLVGYWPLAGNGKDMTPYGDNGTVNNAAYTSDQMGISNSALEVNGAGTTYMEVVPSITVSGSFSVSFWMNPANTPSTNVGIFSTRSPVEYGFDIQLQTNELHGDVGNGSSWLDTSLNANYTFTPGQWYNVVYAVNGTQTVIYVDGVAISTITYASGTPLLCNSSSHYIYLGDPIYTSSSYDGALSQLRVYNRVINNNEAEALYSSYNSQINLGQGENNLIAQWLFNGNLKDSSPYGNNATASGTMTYAADRNGQANGALDFGNTTNSVTAQIGNGTYFGGNNPLTAMAWVDVSSSSSGPVFGVTSGGWDMPFISLDGTTAYGWIYNNAQLSYTLTPGWHNLALTYSPSGSGTTIFYVDGQPVATGTGEYSASGAIDSFTTDIPGLKPAGVNQYLINTSISDVRAYSTALSGSQIASIVGSYHSQISGSSLMKGLMGYWPLDGNTKDASPYSDNATLNGQTLTTDREGRPNSAYSFNGTSSMSANLSFNPGGTNTMTISAWIKRATASSTGIIASNMSSFAMGVGVTPCSTNQIKATKYNVVDICIGNLPADTNWHNLTVVWSSTGVYDYVDGQLNGSSSDTSDFATASGALYIGGAEVGWTGSIGNVRIYNRALSSSEVEALYASY